MRSSRKKRRREGIDRRETYHSSRRGLNAHLNPALVSKTFENAAKTCGRDQAIGLWWDKKIRN